MTASSARRQVVLLGDSHLARLSRDAIDRLERAIGGGATVHDHAFGGANSLDVLRRAPFEARAAEAVFVLSVGANDLAPWKQVDLGRFSAAVTETLRILGAARVVLLAPLPVDEHRQRRVRGAEARTNALVTAYADAVRRIASASGARVLDLGPRLAATDDPFTEDGVHLGESGTELLLAAIAEALRDPGTTSP
jgi:lysophospholipase L1-like esterase